LLRVCVLLGAAGLIGACSLPVEIPMASLKAKVEPVMVTGSVDEVVVDNGVGARVGSVAWESLRPALVSAAEHGQDGEAFAWTSAGGGAEQSVQGTVTAIDAFFDEGGAVCRRLSITAAAYQRQDAFSAQACRRDGGGWTVKTLTGEA
jgi:surface antigen